MVNQGEPHIVIGTLISGGGVGTGKNLTEVRRDINGNICCTCSSYTGSGTGAEKYDPGEKKPENLFSVAVTAQVAEDTAAVPPLKEDHTKIKRAGKSVNKKSNFCI